MNVAGLACRQARNDELHAAGGGMFRVSVKIGCVQLHAIDRQDLELLQVSGRRSAAGTVNCLRGSIQEAPVFLGSRLHRDGWAPVRPRERPRAGSSWSAAHWRRDRGPDPVLSCSRIISTRSFNPWVSGIAALHNDRARGSAVHLRPWCCHECADGTSTFPEARWPGSGVSTGRPDRRTR